MNIKSSFTHLAILFFFSTLCMTFVISIMVYSVFIKKLIETEPGILCMFFFFLMVWTWLFWGEMRTKMIMIKLIDDEIFVRRFFGFGRKRRYSWFEFEGYRTCIVPSKAKDYEFLFLLKNGQRVIKISDMYHDNYSVIKKAVVNNTRFLGKEYYSYLNDLKEIFE